MPQLVSPDVRYHCSFLESLAEWGDDEQSGAGVAADRGYDRVLIACEATNYASAATIVRAGGVFDDARTFESTTMRRYWIDLTSRSSEAMNHREDRGEHGPQHGTGREE